MLLYKLIIESEHLEEVQEVMRKILESREPIEPGTTRRVRTRTEHPVGPGAQLRPADLPPALVPMAPIAKPQADKSNDGTEPVCCVICKKMFTPKNIMKKKPRTCSKSCYNVDWYRRKHGEGQAATTAKPANTPPRKRGRKPNEKVTWGVTIDGKASTLTGSEERLNNMVDQYRVQGKVVEIISQ